MAENIRVNVVLKPSFESIVKRYDFTPRQVQQIGSVAINRTLTTERSHIVKTLATKINMRQKDIRDLIIPHNANYNSLRGDLTISRKAIPLIDFIGTRETRHGVTFQTLKNRPRMIVEDAFIATMKSGHTGVFERRRRAGKYAAFGPRMNRLPIDERYGRTLTGYLHDAPAVVEAEQAVAGDTLRKNVLSQIQRRLAEKE